MGGGVEVGLSLCGLGCCSFVFIYVKGAAISLFVPPPEGATYLGTTEGRKQIQGVFVIVLPTER